MAAGTEGSRGRMDRLSTRDETNLACSLIVEVKRNRFAKPKPVAVPALIVDVSATGAGMLLDPTAAPAEVVSPFTRALVSIDGSTAEVIVRHVVQSGPHIRVGVEFDSISHQLLAKLHASSKDIRGLDTEQVEEMWNRAN